MHAAEGRALGHAGGGKGLRLRPERGLKGQIAIGYLDFLAHGLSTVLRSDNALGLAPMIILNACSRISWG